MTHPDEVRVGDHSYSDQPQRARQRHRHASSNDLARPPADVDAVSPGALRVFGRGKSRIKNKTRKQAQITAGTRYEVLKVDVELAVVFCVISFTGSKHTCAERSG